MGKPTYKELEKRLKELEKAGRGFKEADKAPLENSESNSRFFRLFEQSPVPIEIFSPDGTQIYVNKAWKKLWNIDESYSPGTYNVLENEQIKEMGVFEAVKKALAGEIIEIPEEKFDPAKSGLEGEARYLHTKMYPIKDSRGELECVVISHEDITERKKIEEALRDSEEKYKMYIQNAPNGVFVFDSNGKFLEVNEMACKLSGYPRAEMLNISVSDLFSPLKPEAGRNHFNRLLKEGKSSGEVLVRKKDGSDNCFLVEAVRLSDGRFIGFSNDINERKEAEKEKNKLEEQLFQAQKMESIGRLAGGIAHDFNNILTGIMGYAELLKWKFQDRDSTEGEAVKVIIEGVERASSLTRQLLSFARGGAFNPVPVNINREIEDTIKVSEKIFEKKIAVRFDFEREINPIEADRIQVDQVLTNIIINAKDAMPFGGELIFKTENVKITGEHTKNYPNVKPGDYVKISITDSGIGMTKEVKNHIFEPFFSTKGEVRGTGLGLASVYGIVKNHNGYIHVSSEPGRGSTFIIYFPASDKDVIKKKTEPMAIKGEATILIADDEQYIRNLLQDQLTGLGYKVLLAECGNEAIDIYAAKKDEIDLVLLDAIMPKMPGQNTILDLKKVNPQVKIILMSGYSKEEIPGEITGQGVREFIQKPFKMHILTKMIYDALTGE